MYLYYGLAGLKIRLCKPYYITTLQISQMVVGVAVCCSGGYYIAMGKGEEGGKGGIVSRCGCLSVSSANMAGTQAFSSLAFSNVCLFLGETKYISKPNFQAGVVMYLSYMMLFLQYALGRFLPGGKVRLLSLYTW